MSNDSALDLMIQNAVFAERERCAGILRLAIRGWGEMLGTATVDHCHATASSALSRIQYLEECSVKLSEAEAMQNEIAAAVMAETERCAKIAETHSDIASGMPTAAAIGAKIRSGE